jgi:hypothetical protein
MQRFNSGRGYSEHGQRIVYKVLEVREDDGMTSFQDVAFYDIDRSVGGVLFVIACGDLKEADIMSAYDAGEYKPLPYALMDQMIAYAN